MLPSSLQALLHCFVVASWTNVHRAAAPAGGAVPQAQRSGRLRARRCAFVTVAGRKLWRETMDLDEKEVPRRLLYL